MPHLDACLGILRRLIAKGDPSGIHLAEGAINEYLDVTPANARKSFLRLLQQDVLKDTPKLSTETTILRRVRHKEQPAEYDSTRCERKQIEQAVAPHENTLDARTDAGLTKPKRTNHIIAPELEKLSVLTDF
jgi:hypothetical protein